MSSASDPRHLTGHPSFGEYTLADFESADAGMGACLELARAAARTELPILILGETGTGKTILAHATHNSSKRATAPFVSFNSAALSDTLLDSQLFGHDRGAFTGAARTVRGKFELADKGTLFVDEIADLSPAAQAKILRAVEYGEFERLGSETLHVADVRLMSATHLPLGQFVESAQFRKDLFYRISGVTLNLPPLRERPNDLRALIAKEIGAAARSEGKSLVGLSRGAADILFSYHWPGNLRELKRVIHSAVALCTGDVLRPESILFSAPLPGLGSNAWRSAGLPAAEPDLTLRTAEERHIRSVLASFGGNKRQAARALDISRATLDRKLSPGTAPVPEHEMDAPVASDDMESD